MTCTCGHEYDEHDPDDDGHCAATDFVAPGSWVECPCIHFEAGVRQGADSDGSQEAES